MPPTMIHPKRRNLSRNDNTLLFRAHHTEASRLIKRLHTEISTDLNAPGGHYCQGTIGKSPPRNRVCSGIATLPTPAWRIKKTRGASHGTPGAHFPVHQHQKPSQTRLFSTPGSLSTILPHLPLKKTIACKSYQCSLLTPTLYYHDSKRLSGKALFPGSHTNGVKAQGTKAR